MGPNCMYAQSGKEGTRAGGEDRWTSEATRSRKVEPLIPHQLARVQESRWLEGNIPVLLQAVEHLIIPCPHHSRSAHASTVSTT